LATRATEPARIPRLVGPLGVAGLGIAAAVALHVRDPHRAGAWGFCPFRVLTGWDCPGCGGLRAVNDLTHLDVASAASSHLLLVLAVPLLALGWLLWVRAAATGRALPRIRWTPLRTLVLLGVVLGFTVVRNTAWGAWLASGPTIG
jgi:hypothetical protein